jgi:lipid-A-disaccharide synthase-like uncharacterized protein
VLSRFSVVQYLHSHEGALSSSFCCGRDLHVSGRHSFCCWAVAGMLSAALNAKFDGCRWLRQYLAGSCRKRKPCTLWSA